MSAAGAPPLVPESPEGESRKHESEPSAIVEAQNLEEMHRAPIAKSKNSKSISLPVSSGEILLRGLPTLAFMVIMVLVVTEPPGPAWGVPLLILLLALMVLSIKAWIPKVRPR